MIYIGRFRARQETKLPTIRPALIMEELKQVKQELDLLKSTTSLIASVSCTDNLTMNDVAETATLLSLPINDSSIMSSIDIVPRPMRNSPWDDIPQQRSKDSNELTLT